VPRCCPPGYLYDARLRSCAPCIACNDTCPVMEYAKQMACSKYPEFNDITVYRKWTKDGAVLVPCEEGTIFNTQACGCVSASITPRPLSQCQPSMEVNFRSESQFTLGTSQNVVKYEQVRLVNNQGVFNGEEARINVETTPENPYDQPLVMRFEYVEAEELREPKAIVSSSRCQSGGLFLVSIDRGQLKIEMSSYGKTPIIFRLPTDGFRPTAKKEVMLIHSGDTFNFIAKSGSIVYARATTARVLSYLNCGLDFGNSEWMKGFNGTISRVQLQRCVPDDFFSLV